MINFYKLFIRQYKKCKNNSPEFYHLLTYDHTRSTTYIYHVYIYKPIYDLLSCMYVHTYTTFILFLMYIYVANYFNFSIANKPVHYIQSTAACSTVSITCCIIVSRVQSIDRKWKDAGPQASVTCTCWATFAIKSSIESPLSRKKIAQSDDSNGAANSPRNLIWFKPNNKEKSIRCHLRIV